MNGRIDVDSPEGIEFGFVSKSFSPLSYLWKLDNTIIVSLIFDSAPGSILGLFSKIAEKGFDIQVPTPFSKMERLLNRLGFEESLVYDHEFGEMIQVYSITANQYNNVDRRKTCAS